MKTDGARLEIAFPGVHLGVFTGRLQFTVYQGTNLIRQEVVAKTSEPSVAYKYDSTTDLAPFGRRRFAIPFNATGKKWVRFAAWDTAGNGAFVQPVKLHTATSTDAR